MLIIVVVVPSFLSGRSLGTSTVYPFDRSSGGLGTIDRSMGLTVMTALGERAVSVVMNLVGIAVLVEVVLVLLLLLVEEVVVLL